MNLPALSETLLTLIDAFESSDHEGLRITGAEVEAPLQLHLQRRDQQLVLQGAPAVTVMRTGFEAVVHRVRLTLAPSDTGPDHGVSPGEWGRGG